MTTPWCLFGRPPTHTNATTLLPSFAGLPMRCSMGNSTSLCANQGPTIYGWKHGLMGTAGTAGWINLPFIRRRIFANCSPCLLHAEDTQDAANEARAILDDLRLRFSLCQQGGRRNSQSSVGVAGRSGKP